MEREILQGGVIGLRCGVRKHLIRIAPLLQNPFKMPATTMNHENYQKIKKKKSSKNNDGRVVTDLRIWTTFDGLRAAERAGEGELISTPTSRIQDPRSKDANFLFPALLSCGFETPNRYFSN